MPDPDDPLRTDPLRTDGWDWERLDAINARAELAHAKRRLDALDAELDRIEEDLRDATA